MRAFGVALGLLTAALLVSGSAGGSAWSSGLNARTVEVGSYDTCAITQSGGVKCWGDNEFAALGRGNFTHTDSLTPVQVVGLTSGVTSISAGTWAACAIVTGGHVKCWGSSLSGGRKDGDSAKAVPVSRLGGGMRAVSVGEGACALTGIGGVECWGLGPTITRVPGLSRDVASISAGDGRGFACAVTTGHVARCWGDNHFGELGDGTTRNTKRPTRVAGLSGVVQVATGDYHACALTSAGAVKCWGDDEEGQLGDGTKKSSNRPVAVAGLHGKVVQIAAGGDHACARLETGGVACWGEAQANGRKSASTIAADVSRLGTTAVSISAGGPTSCAQVRGGGIRCWGYNGHGQLGDGTRRDTATPVVVRSRPRKIVAPKLVVGTRSILLPGKVDGLSADGPRIALRQVRGTYDRPCTQVLAWTPGRKAVTRLPEKCSTSPSTFFDSLTLAGSRLLWANYTYGNFAYCSGPYQDALPKTKATFLKLCTGEESDEYIDLAGDGPLVAVSRYDYCEGQCLDANDNPLPNGDYNVGVYRLTGTKLVRILKPVDHRTLLGVDAGRIVVSEPGGQIVLYKPDGTKIVSVPAGSSEPQAVLSGDRLTVKAKATLNVYDASSGNLVRSQPIAEKANLRDAQNGIAVYTRAGAIHLVGLASGHDVVLRNVQGLVGAEIEAPGLVYAYNVGKRGHVVLVPFGEIARRVGIATIR
jgi:hypothetical protein